MRNNHYAFAHRVLRSFANEHPSQLLDRLTSIDAVRFLAWLWARTAQLTGEELDDIDTAQTTVSACVIADRRAVVIGLPAPVHVAEAFHVVLTWASPEACRYFVLELGEPCGGALRTVLCEWVADTHRNYGDGPFPAADALIAAIGKHLLATGGPGDHDHRAYAKLDDQAAPRA